MDLGHELTDKELEKLERKIAKEYKIAVRDMEKKLQDYLDKTEAQRQVQEQLWKDGKITKQDYTDWCYRHEMVGKRWENMRDTLAADMHKTNEIALGITKSKMPDVYALNVNYATYGIEHDGLIDTGFTLYNKDTANYLLGDQRQLMPKPSKSKAKQIAANKDLQWNKQKIQSAVLQGVLQGESAYKVAERLRSVGQMNYNASIRYARTMTTSAQNAGRYEAFRRASKLGVDLTIEWYATLDHATRHDHRLMHGQRHNVDEPFVLPDGTQIMYPADCTGTSTAPQKEIWNCRCTLLSWVKGFEGETVKDSPKMGGMTYDEWLEEKAPKPKQEPQQEKKPETKPEPKAEPKKREPVVFGDKLAKSLGNDADEFAKLLESAPEEMGELYTQYSDQLNSVSKGSGCYYDALKSLEWNYRKQGNKWHTLAHEYGHFVDDIIPNTAYTTSEVKYINEQTVKNFGFHYKPKIVSESASCSDEFLSAMRTDRNALRMFNYDAKVREDIRNDLLLDGKRNITSGVQDAFDGFWGTQDKHLLPWGHGDKYYNRVYNRRVSNLGLDKELKQALNDLGMDASNQAKVKKIMRDYETSSELWANIQAAKTCGGTELEYMEKYFPEACKAYDEIIKKALGK